MTRGRSRSISEVNKHFASPTAISCSFAAHAPTYTLIVLCVSLATGANRSRDARKRKGEASEQREVGAAVAAAANVAVGDTESTRQLSSFASIFRRFGLNTNVVSSIQMHPFG